MPILAIESGDVLSLGLLVLAVLSFFLGMAGLASLWRFRPGAFSRVVRPQAWRALIPTFVIVLINLVGIPAAGLIGHQSVDTQAAGTQADAEVFKLIVLAGMLVVLLFTNYVAVSLQRRLGQLRLHGEADPQMTRRLTRPPRPVAFVRENLIPGTALLAISILVWYLIDKQLSDTVPMDVVVQIDLQTGDEDWRWIVTEAPRDPIKMLLQGPREQVARLESARDVRLVVRYTPEATETGEPTSVALPINTDGIELLFDGARKPDNVTVSSSTDVIRFTVVRNRDPQRIRIKEEWVLRAMVNRPNGLVPKIRQIDPPEAWLVYPMQEDPITELTFDTHELTDLASLPLDQARVRKLTISIPEGRHIKVFSSRALTREIEVSVTIEFDTSPPPVERPVDNVLRTVRASAALSERGVQIELPVHNGSIRIRGPREVVDSITANDVELVIVINDAAIDWERFEREGRFAVPDCRYRIAGRGRWSRGLPAGVELVEPRPDSSIAVTLIR